MHTLLRREGAYLTYTKSRLYVDARVLRRQLRTLRLLPDIL